MLKGKKRVKSISILISTVLIFVLTTSCGSITRNEVETSNISKNVSKSVSVKNTIGVVQTMAISYEELHLPKLKNAVTSVTSRVSGEAMSIIIPGNANVSVSSSMKSDKFSLDYVYDGDVASESVIGWSSKPTTDSKTKEWVLIDYKRLHFINRIDLYPRSDAGHIGECFPKTIKIEVSNDGGNWQTVSNVTGYSKPMNNDPVVLRFSTQLAQFIRITGSDLRKGSVGYAMQFNEIMAYYQNYKPGAVVVAKNGATYYVSSSTGSDNNDGLSIEKPFKTLVKASSLLYGPGNRILFKKGDVWQNQIFYPDGNGEKDNPIAIGAYGEGKKPVFMAGNTGGSGIKLIDQSYISITGLEFSNSIFGILAVADETINNKGLYISDCNFNNMTCPTDPDPAYFLMPYPEAYFAAGINIVCFGKKEYADKTYYSDIKIDNCNFDRTDAGILNTLNDHPMDLSGYPTVAHTNFSTSSLLNVDVSNVNISKAYRSGGIMLYGCKDSSIDNAFITQTGYEKGMYWGTCAAQISMCENFVTKNSEFCFTEIQPGNSDGEGFDFESGNINCTLYNTYIHDNVGPAILLYGGNAGWRSANTGCIIDSCILENNDKEIKVVGVFNYYTGNGGAMRNTTIKLTTDEQTLTYNNRAFDELFIYENTNRVINASGTVTSGKTVLTVDDSANIVYDANWSLSNDNHISTGNAVAKFRFFGSTVYLNGALASGATGRVFIDGIDCGALGGTDVIFTKTGLKKGTHLVRIVTDNAGVTLSSIKYKNS